MQKGWIGPISLIVGVLAAAAWCLVFVLNVWLRHQPAEHVHWGRVAVGAAISFIVGWSLIRFAARERPERPKEQDDDF